MEVPEFEDALAAARHGDERALTEIFRALQPRLLRYLRRQAPHLAEDLASETWLAISRQLPSFEGTWSDFRALLFTIARRRVVDHYRAEGRRPRLDLGKIPDDQPGGDDPAERVVADLSAQQAIDRLVRSLPPAQAEVLLLRVVADLSVEEVAGVLDRSAGAVRVLQHRALRQLAKNSGSEADLTLGSH